MEIVSLTSIIFGSSCSDIGQFLIKLILNQICINFIGVSGVNPLKFKYLESGCYGDTCSCSNPLPPSALRRLGDYHSYYHFWCFDQDGIHHIISQGKTIMTSGSSC